jgi:UrcA family protein
MFNRSLSALAAMALTAGTVAFSSAPACAAEADQEVTVALSDLDLSTSADQAKLDRRVKLAARQLCGDVPVLDFRQASVVSACRNQAIENARADVQIARNAAGTRMARLALRLR